MSFSGDGWSSTWETEPEFAWMGGKKNTEKF